MTALLSGGRFRSGRHPGGAVEEGAECVDFRDAPFCGGGADGGADGYYETLAQNLVAAGFGSSYIRLGWEFNADWMGWGICNEDGSGLASWASDFVPAFQNIVTSMRSVGGANFKFIWNPIDSSNASCPGANLENFYPGYSYVDAVALDAWPKAASQLSP